MRFWISKSPENWQLCSAMGEFDQITSEQQFLISQLQMLYGRQPDRVTDTIPEEPHTDMDDLDMTLITQTDIDEEEQSNLDMEMYQIKLNQLNFSQRRLDHRRRTNSGHTTDAWCTRRSVTCTIHP